MRDFAFAGQRLLIKNLAGPRHRQTMEAFEAVPIPDQDEGGEVVIEERTDNGPRGEGRMGSNSGRNEVAEHGERDRRAAFAFGLGRRVEFKRREGKGEAEGAGEDEPAGRGLGGEAPDKFRCAVEVINEGRPAEAVEEGGGILAGPVPEGRIVEGEIGMSRELAA